MRLTGGSFETERLNNPYGLFGHNRRVESLQGRLLGSRSARWKNIKSWSGVARDELPCLRPAVLLLPPTSEGQLP